MGGCACNKNRTVGVAAKRVESNEPKTTAKTEPAPRGATSRQAPMNGKTQSFALEHNGKTARFGSRLERDAAAARTGARPL
uniref:HNH endonuclease n=2 Tax=unclassified bacterial viruses TaxID=12333 RepID=A0AAU7J7F5_9VIRU